MFQNTNPQREKEEYLENLWYMHSEKKDDMSELKNAMGEEFNSNHINELNSDGLVNLTHGDSKITLTDDGVSYAKKIIRSHRIAERLVYDAMGGEFETAACEFEHTVIPELVDSICILLGHPRECPHGMPIPKGVCCKNASKAAGSSVIPMSDLDIGKEARVAYVQSDNDRQLHKLDNLQIRPKALVKLHQTYPSFVIACEDTHIAIDKEIVDKIFVWKDQQDLSKRGQEISASDQMDFAN